MSLTNKPDSSRSGDGGAVSVSGRLTDLTPDARNGNRGTERGRSMLENSLRRHGAGRSILTDRNGKIIAGNHVAEVAVNIGLEDRIAVPTDGRKLVVVQRTDLDLDSPAARELSIADNRTGEVGLSWDPGILAELAADDAVDLSRLFSSAELADLLHEAAPTPRFEPIDDEVALERLQRHCKTCTCRQGDQS